MSPGGERVLEVFDVKLKESIYKLPFDKILTLKNVRNTINEADGYQPHIIAPEAGYRRLIEDGLTLLRDPCKFLFCLSLVMLCELAGEHWPSGGMQGPVA
jgi:hypothetical protein